MLLWELLLGNNFGKTAVFEFKLQLACYALLIFHGLFRPAEILALTRHSITLANGFIFVRVRGKTEVRFNRPAVAVKIVDPFLYLLLAELIEYRGERRLFFETSNVFSRFCRVISLYWPNFPRLTPYSFKRGGASHMFKTLQQYDPVVEQGRWDSVSSARRYIDSAIADQMLFVVNPAWRARFQHAHDQLKQFAERGGGGGSSSIFS